jgi:2EXR family protein
MTTTSRTHNWDPCFATNPCTSHLHFSLFTFFVSSVNSGSLCLTLPCHDKMFTLFPHLPAEIRLQVWRKAIEAPAVWFAVLRDHNYWDPPLQRGDLTLVPVGPAPYLAGLACRESRHEMETVITNPIRSTVNPQFFIACSGLVMSYSCSHVTWHESCRLPVTPETAQRRNY